MFLCMERGAVTSEIYAKPNELITVLGNSWMHFDRYISSANTNMLQEYPNVSEPDLACADRS